MTSSSVTTITSNGTEFSNKATQNIAKAYGPTLQAAIAVVNEAYIALCITAARLGGAEPLAPALLGMSRDILDELAENGRAQMLISHAYGLPLVELRIKDPVVLRRVMSEGFGSPQALAEITKTMPLEVITKLNRRN